MLKNKIWLGVILSIILLIFSINGFTAYYKYTQESGANFYVGTADKSDALEDTNEIRQILDDLGFLLQHSKRDDSYPKDGTTGGTLGIFADYYLKTAIDSLSKVESIWSVDVTDSTELATALTDYYLKTAIDSLSKMETIWGLDVTTSTELETYCETTQAYYNAIGDLPIAAVTTGDTTHVPTSAGVFTFCETTKNYALYSELHAEVTLGTANGLSLDGQELSLQLATTDQHGALSDSDWNTFNGKQAGDTALTNISALAYVSPSYIKLTGDDTYAVRTLAEIKEDLSLNYVENLKVKLDGTQAPTVNNDVDEGYVVGSRWFDITNDKEYVCLDNTDGAAVWTETTGAGGGASQLSDLSDVGVTTPTDKYALMADGDSWESRALVAADLSDVNNIVICANYDHPDDAITAIGATEVTLLVTETETCDTNFTVPANVTVKFERGGKWTINNGITVTFNGQLVAPPTAQIFALTGTGVVNFGDSSVKGVYPQWWGAKADGTTDDITEIQNAIDSISTSGGIVYFPIGTYIINSTINLKSQIGLVGFGRQTIIQASGTFTLDDNILSNDADISYIIIKDLMFECNHRANGIYLNDSDFAEISNIYVTNYDRTGSYGIYLNSTTNGAVLNKITGVHLNGYGGIYIKNSGIWYGDNYFQNIRIRGATKGIVFDGEGSDNSFYGMMIDTDSEDAGARGIDIGDTATDNTFVGVIVENTSANGTGIECPTAIHNSFFAVRVSTGFSTTWNVHANNNIFGSSNKISQLTFPATQIASSGVNTLDDYKEGEWTPDLEFGGASVDMTYIRQGGYYTKIGRQVTITGWFGLSAKGSSTGSATIQGLPFTSIDNDAAIAVPQLSIRYVTFANVFESYIYKNTSAISLMEVLEDGTRTALTEGNFADNSDVMITATYFTD